MNKKIFLSSIILGAVALSGCSKSNEYEMKGNFSNLPEGVSKDDKTGITINVEKDSLKFTCPEGYVLPTVAVDKLPARGYRSHPTDLELKCTNIAGCDMREFTFSTRMGGATKNVFEGDNKFPYYQASFWISNRDEGFSVMCVPKDQANEWKLGNS